LIYAKVTVNNFVLASGELSAVEQVDRLTDLIYIGRSKNIASNEVHLAWKYRHLFS
jgi:hypothetical protein